MIPLPLTAELIIENGRIALPAKLRKSLSERNINSIVIARGYDQCLYLYLPEEWNLHIERMKQIPRARGRSLIRKLLFGATEEKIDKQGRLVIPQILREYAQISKEIILIGLPERIEVWDKKAWEGYDSSVSFEELGEELEKNSA
ncbi:MAG: division/cell wall cluster transcriptional repressor MraZ [bacterium]|nr:division/cell wall cluster transcriptional repressor MraZ [bacterium]